MTKDLPASQQLRFALNSYKSSVASADGYVSGRRVATLRIDEKTLRDLLWEHREEIVAVMRRHGEGADLTADPQDGAQAP